MARKKPSVRQPSAEEDDRIYAQGRRKKPLSLQESERPAAAIQIFCPQPEFMSISKIREENASMKEWLHERDRIRLQPGAT